MAFVTSRTFRSGNSEAVQLPKELAFGAALEVTIARSGDVLTIFPKRKSLADMAARLLALPGPGEIEIRDADVIPDRSPV